MLTYAVGTNGKGLAKVIMFYTIEHECHGVDALLLMQLLSKTCSAVGNGVSCAATAV